MKSRICAVALVVAGLGGEAAAQAKALPPPPADIGRLALPAGELAPVAMGTRQASFVETVSVTKRGDVVEVRTLELYAPGVPTERGAAVEMVVRRSVDCARRTMREHGSMAYDAAGGMVMWLPAYEPEPIEANQVTDFLARMVCDGAAPPRPAVVGHAAALAAWRRELGR